MQETFKETKRSRALKLFDIQFDTWKDNDGICLDDLEKKQPKTKNYSDEPYHEKKNGMIKCNSSFSFFAYHIIIIILICYSRISIYYLHLFFFFLLLYL